MGKDWNTLTPDEKIDELKALRLKEGQALVNIRKQAERIQEDTVKTTLYLTGLLSSRDGNAAAKRGRLLEAIHVIIIHSRMVHALTDAIQGNDDDIPF